MRLLLLLTLGCVTRFAAAQNVSGSFVHDEETREYIVYLPDAYSPGTALPLVINLHGFGSNSSEQRLYSGMNLVAETEGFIVVYPQGLPRQAVFGGFGNSWDAGFGTDVDDVGFLSALIDRLWTDYGIDLSRVYATGMSNGGYMSYELACSLSDRIAAVASVTGSMTLETFDNCDPQRPVPVLQFHGTADPVVAYNGIPFFSKGIEEVIDYWVTFNGCPAPADTTQIDDSAPNDGSTVALLAYDDCAAGTDVEFYKIFGGGHTWPGAFPIPGAGSTNQDIQASPLIWAFFDRYTHPDPRPGTLVVATRAPTEVGRLAVRPNPVHDLLRVEVNGLGAGELRVVDATGRPLLQRPFPPTASLRLFTADWAAGVYTLHLRTNDGRVYARRITKL